MAEKFSVLMSVYHREKGEFLRTSLSSVFAQTVLPNEVVLVEDGPLTDDLYAVIEDLRGRYEMLKVIALPQNVGSGIARNKGVENCRYELVANVDSDDICMPNRFEEQLKVFAAHPELSVVGSWVDEFEDTPQNVISTRKLPKSPDELKLYAASRNPVNQPSVMFKKSAVVSVGGYLPFYLFEDYFLWVRLLKGGFQLYNIPASLVLMRTGDGMFARRGGWKYAVSELKFFITLYKMNFIGAFAVVKNVAIRFPVRIMPNKIRTFVYQKLLR